MADPIITIEAPARSPREGGLLDVVDVRENVQYLGAAIGAQWISGPCGVEFGDTGWCYGSVDPATPKSITDGPETLTTVIPNFAGYYGQTCFLGPDMDYDTRAREGFEWTESRYVESKLNTWFATLAGAVGVALVAAIGAAEDQADREYIGRPVLHMSRANALAAFAAGALVRDGGRLVTANGTPVVASGEYAGDAIVITGSVTVLKSALVETGGAEIQKNTRMDIAERIFGVAIDCAYAVRFLVTP